MKTNIFSHVMVVFLFYGFLCRVKLLNLIRSLLFIFVFFPITLGSRSKNILLWFMSENVLSNFPLRVLWYPAFRSLIHFEFCVCVCCYQDKWFPGGKEVKYEGECCGHFMQTLPLSPSFRIISECPSCPGTFSPFIIVDVVSLSFKVTPRVLNHIKPTISQRFLLLIFASLTVCFTEDTVLLLLFSC